MIRALLLGVLGIALLGAGLLVSAHVLVRLSCVVGGMVVLVIAFAGPGDDGSET